MCLCPLHTSDAFWFLSTKCKQINEFSSHMLMFLKLCFLTGKTNFVVCNVMLVFVGALKSFGGKCYRLKRNSVPHLQYISIPENTLKCPKKILAYTQVVGLREGSYWRPPQIHHIAVSRCTASLQFSKAYLQCALRPKNTTMSLLW